MNTPQPTRRSARLANRQVTIRTTPERPATPVSVCPTPSPVKTRHSARMALRPRPNYYEPEEWEVEDPIYPSNTPFRTHSDLSESDLTKLLSEVARLKEVLNRVGDYTLPMTHRHYALIQSFWICRGMEIVIPMFPKFRATVRDNIRKFEQNLREENCPMLPQMQLSLQDAMYAMKKALANVHCSPFYVAVEN